MQSALGESKGGLGRMMGARLSIGADPAEGLGGGIKMLLAEESCQNHEFQWLSLVCQ